MQTKEQKTGEAWEWGYFRSIPMLELGNVTFVGFRLASFPASRNTVLQATEAGNEARFRGTLVLNLSIYFLSLFLVTN